MKESKLCQRPCEIYFFEARRVFYFFENVLEVDALPVTMELQLSRGGGARDIARLVTLLPTAALLWYNREVCMVASRQR